MIENEQSFNAWEYSAKIVAIAVISASVLLGFFLSFCIIYFPPKTIGNQLVNWGLLGDFFGGILATIISLASLGITIYLALILHRIERENSVKNISAQKSMVRMQFKFQELTAFISTYDDAFSSVLLVKPNIGLGTRNPIRAAQDEITTLNNSIDKARNSIYNATERIRTLFPELRGINSNHFLQTLDNSFLNAVDMAKSLNNQFIIKGISAQERDNFNTTLGISEMNYRSTIFHLTAWLESDEI